MSDRYPGGFLRAVPAPDLDPALGNAAPGMWTLEQYLKYQKAGTWPAYDPYFNQTVLSLHGNGANGAQNNTFLDSSSNGFTITRNGNTTQGTFSPFSVGAGEWSNWFNGSTGYLTSPNNAAIQLDNSTAFTIECWFYANSMSTTQAICRRITAGSPFNGYAIVLGENGEPATTLQFWDGSAFRTIKTGLSPNQWYHIAVSFEGSGTTLRFFVNGTQEGSALTVPSGISNTSLVLGIGANQVGSQLFNGYISNFRIVKGTAVYTAAFTPSTTPLTAITNTSLLTCQSNRFVDNSTNNFAITRNGDVKVTPFSPFAPTAAYSASVNGGSGYFDGTGDYLQVANDNVFDTNSTFTLEVFVYLNSTSAQIFFGRGGGTGSWSTTNGHQFLLFVESGNLYWMWNNAGTNTQISTTAPAINQWVHLAVGYDGTTTRFWVNGSSVGSSATGYTLPTTRNIIYIGASPASAAGPVNGFISSLRFVKGTDVYGVSNTSITVPTAPPTNITNTALLTNFTNAGIFDQTGKNNLETAGNAQVDTSVVKFGTGSMKFDGTGDGLFRPFTQDLNFGTGDFTIEWWMYFNSKTGYQTIISFGYSPQVSTGWLIQTGNGDGKIIFYTQSAGTTIASDTGSTVNTGEWYHMAVVRSSGTTTIYRNGTSVGSGADTTNYTATAANFYVGGGSHTAFNNYYFNGFIDDLRITKGVARYTSNFTPQTSQWQDQ